MILLCHRCAKLFLEPLFLKARIHPWRDLVWGTYILNIVLGTLNVAMLYYNFIKLHGSHICSEAYLPVGSLTTNPYEA